MLTMVNQPKRKLKQQTKIGLSEGSGSFATLQKNKQKKHTTVVRPSNTSRRVKQIGCKTRVIAVDTETTGVYFRHGSKPFLIATCDQKGNTRCWEWKVDPVTREVKVPAKDKKEIKEYLQGATLVFHHAKFDFRAFETIGIGFHFEQDNFRTIQNTDSKSTTIITCPTFHDTLLASHAVRSSDKHELKWLAKYYLDFPTDDEAELLEATRAAARYCKSNEIAVTLGRSPTGKREVPSDFWLPKVVDPKNDLCLTYARKDVERTTLLWIFFQEILDRDNLTKGYERERRLLQTVYRIENDGITVSKRRLNKKIRALRAESKNYFLKAQQYVRSVLKRKINLNSDQQLSEFLYEKLKLPILARSEKTGKPRVNKETLENLLEIVAEKGTKNYQPKAARFLRNLLCGRAYDSGVKYLLNYKAFGTSHPTNPDFITLFPSLNQSGTDTTRFSSSNPNGQNVSKIALIEIAGEEYPGPRLRDVYGPVPGKIWYAIDYNQLELRTFAACSEDQQLLQALDEGEDFHSYVAVQMHEKPAEEITKAERKSAKYVVFGRIFGAGKTRIDKLAGFKGANDLFSRKLPNVAAFMQKVIKKVRELGHVFTLDGYRLDVPRQLAYKAVNYLAQGSAGSVIKNAMIAIDQKGLVDWITSRIVLQIHDELIIEVDKEHDSPEFVYNIMREMERAGEEIGVSTPVSCERISVDWGHGEEVEVTRKFIKPVKKAA